MTGWQPIETVPEGAWVMGLVEGWNPESGRAPVFVGQRYDIRNRALIDFSKGRWIVCSHWQPLPEPPEGT